MAISYRVDIPQLPALQAAFQRAPELVSRETMAATNRALVGYQGTARKLSPVDTGHLRSSIQIEPATMTGSTIRGAVGTSLRYAPYQETGTGIYGPTHQPIRSRRA